MDEVRYSYSKPYYPTILDCCRTVISYRAISPTELMIWECKPMKIKAEVRGGKWEFGILRDGVLIDRLLP
jgi:hypothetical protein